MEVFLVKEVSDIRDELAQIEKDLLMLEANGDNSSQAYLRYCEEKIDLMDNLCQLRLQIASSIQYVSYNLRKKRTMTQMQAQMQAQTQTSTTPDSTLPVSLTENDCDHIPLKRAKVSTEIPATDIHSTEIPCDIVEQNIVSIDRPDETMGGY